MASANGAIEIADQRHVELDHVGLEQREAGEAGVAGAEIVDGDAKPEPAQRGHPLADVAHAVERGPLGDLEDDPARGGGERPLGGVQLGIEQVVGMEIDEQHDVRAPIEPAFTPFANRKSMAAFPKCPVAPVIKIMLLIVVVKNILKHKIIYLRYTLVTTILKYSTIL